MEEGLGSQRQAPYLLLDRDGTLIVDKHYLGEPEGVELLPGAAEALRRIRTLGFGLVVVTNQSGNGRGYFSHADVAAVHRRLRDLLEREGVTLDGIYYCPHHPDDGCACRKPNTHLVEAAARDLGFDLGNCVVIGDANSDIEMAKTIGAYSIQVLTGTPSGAGSPGDDPKPRPHYDARDLLEAAAYLGKLMELRDNVGDWGGIE